MNANMGGRNGRGPRCVLSSTTVSLSLNRFYCCRQQTGSGIASKKNEDYLEWFLHFFSLGSSALASFRSFVKSLMIRPPAAVILSSVADADEPECTRCVSWRRVRPCRQAGFASQTQREIDGDRDRDRATSFDVAVLLHSNDRRSGYMT